MKNVSNEFKRIMAERANFYQTAHVTFADGAEIDLDKKDFYISGNSYSDSAGSSSFPLGIALEKQISISIVNDVDQYSGYDFYMAKFLIYCNFDLDSGITEQIQLGTFTVTTPETYGSVITVNAVDDMYKGDIDYSTNLTFPITVGDALRDSCTTCGVTLFDTTFSNDDYVIQQKPEGLTHRTLWGLCAMLAGGNARMDEYNRLRIKGYDLTVFDQGGADGGVFDADYPFSSGDSLDGGTFNPWNIGDGVDGGTFIQQNGYHVFWKAKNLTVATDDVVITGIQTTVDEDTYTFGNEGYVLSVTNQIIEGNPQDAIERIGELLVGARFRPFEMDHVAYPLAEFGDVCYLVDRKQNVYQSFITDIDFQFYGYTTLKCSADDPIRNSSKYYSQTTEAVVKARLNTKKQLTSYDLAVQQLTSLITQSFGVFKTAAVLEDGSTVYYLHNKPTLEESQTIWKMTADAFAVSTDGGRTWNAGMDSSGNAVVNVLSAIGINFDWARGGTIVLGGEDNGDGVCKVLDAAGNEVARLDKEGLHTSNAAITGGKFNVVANGGNYSQISVYYDYGTDDATNNQCKSSVSANGFKVLYQGTKGLISGEISGNGFFITSWDGNIDVPGYGSGVVSITDTDAYLPAVRCTSISVSGTKNRVVKTVNFGNVLHYCYEMPSPMFGDIGGGIIGEDGLCYVYFDQVFRETVASDITYYVFLQKEGEGDLWVSEKTQDYFLVCGTPELKFSWEVKVRQINYEYNRLDVYDNAAEEQDIDYANMAGIYLDNYEKEILNYEETN